MRRGHKRHPALETAVFAAALLLSAFVARELWRRRAALLPEPAPVEIGTEPVRLTVTRPPLPEPAAAGRAELGVTAVPPVKLTRVQRRKPKPVAIPAPK